MPELKRSLDSQECLNKALECRHLAGSMRDPAYRTMLENMAQTWERMAACAGRTSPLPQRNPDFSILT